MLIRSRLLLLVVSVVLPLFLAAALAVWFVYQEQQESQSRLASEAARSFALLVDNEMQTAEGILKTLAAAPSLAEGDLDGFRRHALSVAPPEERAIVLSDLRGQQLINTRVPQGAPLPAGNAQFPALRAASGPDASLVSDLFMAPVAKRPDIAVQVPVRIDGDLRYYLGMGMAASSRRYFSTSRRLAASFWRSLWIERVRFSPARRMHKNTSARPCAAACSPASKPASAPRPTMG